ncbi:MULTISPECIES: helix-turn-helix domain-containing protein [Bacillus cereus group]|nr:MULTISPECIES: helix-turn-helix domain-containing protein [Bacillus cereus group]
MPTDLRYYAYMSDYGVNDSVLMLYQLIIDFYNVEEKKAFPSQYRLAMQTGKSLRTIVNNLKVLREVGLIQIKKTGNGSNNEYRPLLPLPPAQLFERYPKALKKLIKQNKIVADIRQRDEKRRKWKVEEAEWQ